MGELIILCGLPGSGKSTWAQSKIDENTIWISRDEIRNAVVGLDKGAGQDKYFSQETTVYNLYIKAIVHHLNQGRTVIADATHTSKGSRNKLLMRLKAALSKLPQMRIIIFDTPLEVCIERNERRQGWRRVPQPAIERMHKEILRDLHTITEEGYNNIDFYNSKGEMVHIK